MYVDEFGSGRVLDIVCWYIYYSEIVLRHV